MAEKEDGKKKGAVGDYNNIPVKVRDYYYDRDETDAKLRKDISDSFTDLKCANNRLKKELDGKKSDVKVEKE